MRLDSGAFRLQNLILGHAARARPVMSPSCAAFIAPAICPGPPRATKRHCIPTRSSRLIPTCGPEASHSSSFRQAIVTNSPVMLPAMALPGSPSMPAVMTALGLMTSNAACTQSEDSWLSGVGPGTNPARKIRSMVSSLRHPKNLVCLSGFSPIHASSVSDSSESIAPESSSWRGTSIPGGAGVSVGPGVGVLAGVAVGAAVGLSVGASVGTGISVGVVVAVGAGVEVGAWVSGAGVGSEQAVNIARVNRMMRVAWGNNFSTGSFLFLMGSSVHSTCRHLNHFGESAQVPTASPCAPEPSGAKLGLCRTQRLAGRITGAVPSVVLLEFTMRWTIFLIAIVLVSTGCSGRAPAESPVPTPTVALPPPTMDLLALSPARVQEWAGQFFDCVQDDDDIGSGFRKGVESKTESADTGPDLKQFLGEGFFEDRDAFVGLLVQGAERGPERVALMSVLLGVMLDLCATDDPLPIEALDIDDAEIELLLGQFHDCLGSDRELRESFLAQGNGEVASRYLEYLLSEKDWYVGLMYAHTVQDAAAARRLKALQDRVPDICP